MNDALFSLAGIPLTSPEGGPPYAAPAYSDSPYAWYAWHRAHRPVLTAQFQDLHCGVGKRHYFFRYVDVRALLSDPRLGREAKFERIERLQDAMPVTHQPLVDLGKKFFFFKDPPDHTRIRGAIQFLFEPSRIKLLERELQKRAHRILNDVKADAEFDVIADFAVPLVLETAQELSGVPYESRSQLHTKGRLILAALGGGFDDARMHAGGEASRWFQDMVGRSLAADGAGESRGWVGELASEVREDSGLRADELVATLILLLIAANDNMISAIGNATSVLCRHPEHWRRLREHPELLPNAIAELIRLESPVQSMERYPLLPFEFSGIELGREDTVVMMLGSANRDERAFPEPEALNFERSGRSPATFGFGIHGCPGSLLGRLLLTAALTALTSRFESIASVEDTFQWRPMVVFRGLERLRVRARNSVGKLG
jgi:cytochrome P450